MRWAAVCLAWIALLPLGSFICAQLQPPSEKVQISAGSAYTWSDASTTVIQLDGDVTITLDRATLHADQAVVWLTPISGGAAGEQHAEIELLGHYEVRQPGIVRSGDHIWVPTDVLSDIHTDAAVRVPRDMRDSPLYRKASEFRRTAATRASSEVDGPTTRSARPTTRRTRPASEPAELGFAVHVEGNIEVADTEEGNVAFVVSGGVVVRVESGGDTIEMQAQRAVLFTAMQSLRDMSPQAKTRQGMNRVTAVYLEGDARIQFDAVKVPGIEERLQAERVYYELATDRAILVDAVMHTTVPKPQIPVILRAKILRQLSKTEYSMNGVELTSSSFAVPSYSIQTDRMQVQTEATGDPEFPERVNFQGKNVTFRAFDVPFFYLPSVAGSLGDRPGAMRQIGFSHRDDLGYSFLSDWGLFETLGHMPPKSLDAAYRIDYFGSRGPAGGLDATYGAGSTTETEHQPLNFNGELRSYLVDDGGVDRDYGRVPIDQGGGTGRNLRGRILFDHTHYLPDNWEAQVRLGYVSDPTFLEEWYPLQFMQEGPSDESLYLKHQRDDEAFTMLVEAQPNRLITTSDRMAEQFEVERYPDIGYHREGDSLGNDAITFFSDNSGAGLVFQPTRATLAQQGFRVPDILPGIPALGQTGINRAITWRGDFREEVDWPIALDHFKVVPYLLGRLTEYSNSPSGNDQSRLFGGAGARVSTTFWRVDPTAESDLFDIHQLRHIIEPTLNLFASGSTVDRSQLYMYDTAVDAINDISGLDVGLHQRWQTQRGGAGQWRSVDVFTVDLDLALFANKPTTFGFRNPTDFRGMFFSTDPETSIPRDAINANAMWRLTDNTVVLADAQYNLDAEKLATGALGVLVRRDVQESFYLGDRYIADLNSNIVSIQVDYTISPKYAVSLGQNFDLGLSKDVSSNIALIRYFDRFVMVFSAGHDQIGNVTSFSFGIMPLGFGQALSSSTLQGPFKH